MRELKFRVYDKISKKMYDSIPINEKFSDNFDIQKFTGLHDKNGKEIWEGDIVNILAGPRKHEKVEIVWWEECASFAFAIPYSLGKYRVDMIEGHGQVVVIGNINENPELIIGNE